MARRLPPLLERFRQPAYTGENRCVPCTLLNLLISGVLSLGLGVVAWRSVGPGVGVAAGSLSLLIAVGAIGLRGYLVPGTPQLTKRYFPDSVLRWFDKAPADSQAPAESAEADIDVEAFLLAAEALEECSSGQDLCLQPSFRAAWFDRIDDVDDAAAATEELAEMLDVDPARLRIEDHGDAFVAVMDGQLVGQWESRPAFLADLGASHVLRGQSSRWAELDVRQRSTVLDGLRLFLDSCPGCGGDVRLGERVVESCCRSIDVVAVTCEACGARLFETETPS
jgi:hypothetical protein